ncbi:phosphatase PAP2 family protein [Brevundimonas sp.]|uniref:phosphatase PAP2 family protein n=1 Tax=Brevundimonas sp. TaxID=1871086 RepID=UPI0037BF824F
MTDFTAVSAPQTVRSGARAFALGLPRLPRLSSEEAAIAAAATIVGLSAAFLMFPGVDLAVSDLFHRSRDGFFLSDNPALRALRKSSTFVMSLMLLAAIGRWIWRVVRRRKADLAARRALFVIGGLALGPGLVVNSVFKELWGRARPVDVQVFGGHDAFTAAWAPSDACQSNCSFISGEGAGAAWMVAAALVLAPRRWRPVAVGLALAYAVSLSANRIAFGGHFLSDVLLSWAVTALVLVLLYRGMKTGLALIRRGRTRPALLTAA